MNKQELKFICDSIAKELELQKNEEYIKGLSLIESEDFDNYNIRFMIEYTTDYVYNILTKVIPLEEE